FFRLCTSPAAPAAQLESMVRRQMSLKTPRAPHLSSVAALGVRPRTGRAVLVVLGGDSRDARVIDRTLIPLLPPGELAPYHAAADLELEAAVRHLAESRKRAHALAASALEDLRRRCGKAGFQVRTAAVLTGPDLPPWTPAEILAVHPRMHQAEIALFRTVM